MKVAVQEENVRMSKITLDLDFSSHLSLDFPLHQLLLVHDLQSTDKAVLTLAGQINTPKLAFAEGLTYLKHTKMENLGDWSCNLFNCLARSRILAVLPLGPVLVLSWHIVSAYMLIDLLLLTRQDHFDR